MSRFGARQKQYLEQFGDRVRFDRTERVLYGHDIAALPSLIRPLVGRTVPDAVVLLGAAVLPPALPAVVGVPGGEAVDDRHVSVLGHLLHDAMGEGPDRGLTVRPKL
jgi:hypothetical protein